MKNLLLSVEEFSDPVKGAVLQCYYMQGRRKVLIPPIKPHFFSERPLYGSEPVKKRLLTRPDVEVELWKKEFFNSFRLRCERNNWKTFHDRIPFEHLIAEMKGFKCPSLLPKGHAFDCESFPSGVGPDPLNDKIRSIGMYAECDEWADCRRDRCKLADFCEKGVITWCCRANGSVASVKKALVGFNKFNDLLDSDVIFGYNSGGYDWPLVLKEAKRCGVRLRIGRDGSTPYIQVREYERRGKVRQSRTVLIGGRVNFDVSKEVFIDQNPDFYEFKRRGLFNVAKYFGFNPMVADHGNITDEQLIDLNLDDCRCTYKVGWIYLSGLCELAEMLSIPLNMIVRRSASHVSNWLLGREYSKMGIVSNGSNSDRFPQFFKRKKKAYQGGFVKCYRTGRFKNVKHIDYVSMYPSIMMMANLSPENVFLVELKPYTGDYKFRDEGKWAFIEVPDANVNYPAGAQVCVKVDMSQDSVMRKKLTQFRTVRAELKAKYKLNKDAALKSRQWAYKILQNAAYGYNGLRYARYGNVLVAILTTSIGRMLIQKLVADLEEKGFEVIEVDTDGVYVGERW